MPFFSVVIPTYNRASLIKTTLDSILNQRFKDFEIIVIDDGSTDNTEEVVNEIIDPRLRYFKKTNGERGAARNFGANLAVGKYINFFDSDDIAYDNHLETAYQYLTTLQPNCEVFHTAYDIIREGATLKSDHTIAEGLVNDELIHENFLSCNNVFIRKDIAQLHPFPEDRRMAVAEDWALWLQLASRYPFHHHTTATSTIVYHDNRSVFDFNIDKIITRDLLLIEYLFQDDHFKEKYKSKLSYFKSSRYTFIALFLAIKNREKEAINYLTKSIITYPKIVFTRRFWGATKNLFK